MRKILTKLYKGEYPLGKSYWFFGNIVPFILFALIISTIFGLSEDPLTKLKALDLKPEGTVATITTIFLSLITLAYIIISTIGVWRSASKHTGRRFWSIAAKVTIVLAFLTYLNDIRKFF